MYKVGYCPLCHKEMIFETDERFGYCYYCGSNLTLEAFPSVTKHPVKVDNNQFVVDNRSTHHKKYTSNNISF